MQTTLKKAFSNELDLFVHENGRRGT